MNYIKSKSTKEIVVIILVIGVLVMAGCNSSSSIAELQSDNQEETAGVIVALPEGTATEELPAIESPTPTFEPTVEPSATETVIVKEFPDPEMVEFDRTTLDLNGNIIEFVVGTEEESNALEIWGQVGIEALIINKDLPDYQEKFSKLILASFWQNTGQEITFEEYLLNIDNYPGVFKSRQMNGRIFEKSFNVKDIKRIEYRILTNPEDPRLYFMNPQSSTIPLGFNYFENGTLTIYQLTRETFIDNANSMVNWGGGWNTIGVKEMLGDQIGLGFPITMLSFPYTMVAGSQGTILRNDMMDRMKIVSGVSGYPYIYNGSGYFRFIKDHGFWSVILN